VVGLVAVGLLARRGEGSLTLRVPRDVAIAGVAWIILCVASVAWSEQRGYSLGELKAELVYPVMAFALFNWGARGSRDLRFAALALLAGAALLGLFIWLAFFLPEVRYAPRYRAIEGYFSTHLVMVAPLLGVAAWPRPQGLDWPWKLVAVAAVVLVAAGLATENRMLWIALGVGAVAGFAAATRGPARAQIARVRTALPLGLAAVGLVVAASAEYKAHRYYPHASDALDAVVFDERPLIWQIGWEAIVERPWLGHGFGRGIVGERIGNQMTERGLVHRYEHAHNIFLDVGLQLGLAGVIVFTALLLALARAYVRAATRPECVLPAIVGVAMLAGFVTKSVTDDFFHRPDSLVFWALNGLLLRLSTDPARGT
jgi:O-antigen ligase